MSVLQWRSRSWVYLRVWPSSTRDRATWSRHEEDCQEASSAVAKGYPNAVVLGWGRGICHRPGLCQVLFALPNGLCQGRVVAPACPAGRTGAFSE